MLYFQRFRTQIGVMVIYRELSESGDKRGKLVMNWSWIGHGLVTDWCTFFTSADVEEPPERGCCPASFNI